MRVERTLRAALALLAVGVGTAGALSLTATELFTSPVTVALVVVSVGLSSLAAAVRVDDDLIGYAGYAIAVSYSVVALFYLLDRFDVEGLWRGAVLLAASAALLAAARSLAAERTLPAGRAALLAAGVVLATLAVGAVDVASNEPQPTVTALRSPEPVDGARYTLAELRIENPSVLPQRSPTPGYAACLSADIYAGDTPRPGRRAPVTTTGPVTDDVVIDEAAGTVETRLPAEQVDEARLRRADVVVTDRCPDDPDDRTVAVYPRRR